MSVDVAVLAATGTVGQKIVRMLEDHPHFSVAEVAASERSVGKSYSEACVWREDSPLPQSVKKLLVKRLDEVVSPYVLSALPADIAAEIEPLLAQRGQHVISNASAMRMGENIPLLIPEINESHLNLIKDQTTTGKIVTNPNCSTVMLSLGLAPLRDVSRITYVSATTLQALSGAGYPGVPSFDLIGNTVPNIGGEEEKIIQESKKILGDLDKAANFGVSVQVNRVPVIHGHTISMHVEFENAVSVAQATEAYLAWNKKYPGLFELYKDQNSPQPARAVTSVDQRIHIGRLKSGDAPNRLSVVALGHNLVRGAAGAALLNLEATYKYIEANV